MGRGDGRLFSGCLRIGYCFFLLVLFKWENKVELCHGLGYTWSGEPCTEDTGLSSAVTRRHFLAFIKSRGTSAASSSKINPVLWLPSSQHCPGKS